MKLNDNLNPKAMLVMYGINKQSSSSYSSEDVYFEYAPILNGVPLGLIPLSDKAAAEMAKALTVSSSPAMGGFIPDRLLYCGFQDYQPTLIWYTEPTAKRLLFSESMGIDPVTINLPWLVWHYIRGTLHLYAAREKPNSKTKLFKAPFANISEGSVCMGTGDKFLDKEFSSFKRTMELIEAVFWGTRFTHQSDKRIIKGNLISLQKKLDKSNIPFPIEALISVKKTVNTLANDKDETDQQNFLNEDEETDEDYDFTDL